MMQCVRSFANAQDDRVSLANVLSAFYKVEVVEQKIALLGCF